MLPENTGKPFLKWKLTEKQFKIPEVFKKRKFKNTKNKFKKYKHFV